jgi:hypothetical protein
MVGWIGWSLDGDGWLERLVFGVRNISTTTIFVQRKYSYNDDRRDVAMLHSHTDDRRDVAIFACADGDVRLYANALHSGCACVRGLGRPSPLVSSCACGYGNTWMVWRAWLRACTLARACPQRGHGSVASAGGSPLTGGGAAGCEDIDGGLPLFFGLIAEPAMLTREEFCR